MFLGLILLRIIPRGINTLEELKKILILNVIDIKSINSKISLVPYRFQSRYRSSSRTT